MFLRNEWSAFWSTWWLLASRPRVTTCPWHLPSQVLPRDHSRCHLSTHYHLHSTFFFSLPSSICLSSHYLSHHSFLHPTMLLEFFCCLSFTIFFPSPSISQHLFYPSNSTLSTPHHLTLPTHTSPITHFSNNLYTQIY
jgi:hypothetical protein